MRSPSCDALRRPLLACLLLLLAACGGEEAPAPASAEAPPPARVQTATARDGTLDEAWTTLGEVVPLARSELAAGAAGPVQSVPFREGDPVGEGAVVLQVDAAPAAARLASAEASVSESEAELARARNDLARLEGVDARVLAATELEAARTSVAALEARTEAARAAALEARVQLARHQVRAPFAGVVTGRHVDPGDWVSAGTPVVDLVSADAVEVRVDAAWELVARLHVGDRAMVLGDDRAVEAEVEVVATVPALDPVTRTSRVRLTPVTSPAPGWLRPGAPVEVRFEVQAEGSGVVVPRDALVLSPDSAKVVRVADGAAQHVDVVVVATGASEALVRGEGLAPGDVVVTRGNERVRPGQPLLTEPGGG